MRRAQQISGLCNSNSCGRNCFRGVPDALLATVYNAMDVFVLPTMGEGFGLPIVESQGVRDAGFGDGLFRLP